MTRDDFANRADRHSTDDPFAQRERLAGLSVDGAKSQHNGEILARSVCLWHLADVGRGEPKCPLRAAMRTSPGGPITSNYRHPAMQSSKATLPAGRYRLISALQPVRSHGLAQPLQ